MPGRVRVYGDEAHGVRTIERELNKRKLEYVLLPGRKDYILPALAVGDYLFQGHAEIELFFFRRYDDGFLQL